MARYIDVDEAFERIQKGEGTSLQKLFAELCLLAVPPADVAPIAEVERLQHILDCYALQYGTVKDQQDVIDKVKNETLSEFLRMVENVCKYEERLSYEKIKDSIKKQIAMKGGV